MVEKSIFVISQTRSLKVYLRFILLQTELQNTNIIHRIIDEEISQLCPHTTLRHKLTFIFSYTLYQKAVISL